MKTVFTFGGENFFFKAKVKNMIEVRQSDAKKKLFTVYYGASVKPNLTYEQACHEIGVAVLHYQCCQGIASSEGA